MPVVNYHTVNGQMVGQSTGTTFTQYLTDALGSVTATVNGKRVTNTYRYKPYGERLAKTGSGPDPDFQWTGDTGSRVTGRSRADQYNRARHYGTSQASWSSVDGLWPREPSHLYVIDNPVSLIDPDGLVHVHLKSFIHRDFGPTRNVRTCDGSITSGWVQVIPNPGDIVFVRGDRRDFWIEGTSRVAAYFNVDECSIGKLGQISSSVRSDLTQGLKVMNNRGNPCYRYLAMPPKPKVSSRVLIEARSETSGMSIVELSYSGSDPLIPGAPKLWMIARYLFQIDLCTGIGNISGRADFSGFPWHEGYYVFKGRGDKVPYLAFTPEVTQGLGSFLEILRTKGKSFTTQSFSVGKCKDCKC